MALARRDRWAWARELERSVEGRLLAGVCSGLSSALSINVTLLRLAFLLLALASGIGVLLYLMLWILVPRADTDRSGRRFHRGALRENLRGMGDEVRQGVTLAGRAWALSGEGSGWPRPLSRRWIAIGLICGGLLIFLYSLGVFSWLGPGRTLGLAIVAVGAAVLSGTHDTGGRKWQG